ncbi:MAG: hypothetical protein ACO1OY_06205 [Ramlibacter sp.]|jgi:hypothetical protein
MSSLPRTRRLLVLLLSAAIAAPAFAGPPEWAGGGRDKGEKHERKAGKSGGEHGGRKGPQQGAWFNAGSRDKVHAYYARNCPPGLAKKNNGCMPPGQAKKWQVGHAVPADVVWVAPPRDVIVLLPPVPVGHRYIQVAGDILLVAVGSMMVVDGISGLMSR